jgi:hypothetical protein
MTKHKPYKKHRSFDEWLNYQIQQIIEHRKQLFQIFLAMVFFAVSVASLQYVPYLAVKFHISDMFFGKAMVYSLPAWILLAFILIWRS